MTEKMFEDLDWSFKIVETKSINVKISDMKIIVYP